jgi:hypothetical protein
MLRTMPGRGYMLAAPVQQSAGPLRRRRDRQPRHRSHQVPSPARDRRARASPGRARRSGSRAAAFCHLRRRWHGAARPRPGPRHGLPRARGHGRAALGRPVRPSPRRTLRRAGRAGRRHRGAPDRASRPGRFAPDAAPPAGEPRRLRAVPARARAARPDDRGRHPGRARHVRARHRRRSRLRGRARVPGVHRAARLLARLGRAARRGGARRGAGARAARRGAGTVLAPLRRRARLRPDAVQPLGGGAGRRARRCCSTLAPLTAAPATARC